MGASENTLSIRRHQSDTTKRWKEEKNKIVLDRKERVD